MAIERKFVSQNLREFQIKQFVAENVTRVGLSDVKFRKTPLGDKIVVHASRPGLVVGRGGANIQMLTRELKKRFGLENPQIEIEEVSQADLDANIVAERIINSLERFGSARTKGIGHRAMSDTMNAGALGVEILISGKIPSMRARRWRFYAGYLKKAGDLAVEGVRHSIMSATLKQGAIGVQVRIMPPTVKLPDDITLIDTPQMVVEEVTDESATEEAPEVVEETAVAEETSEATPKAEEPKEAEAKPEEKPKADQPETAESVSVSEESSSDTEETQ